MRQAIKYYAYSPANAFAKLYLSNYLIQSRKTRQIYTGLRKQNTQTATKCNIKLIKPANATY